MSKLSNLFVRINNSLKFDFDVAIKMIIHFANFLNRMLHDKRFYCKQFRQIVSFKGENTNFIIIKF